MGVFECHGGNFRHCSLKGLDFTFLEKVKDLTELIKMSSTWFHTQGLVLIVHLYPIKIYSKGFPDFLYYISCLQFHSLGLVEMHSTHHCVQYVNSLCCNNVYWLAQPIILFLSLCYFFHFLDFIIVGQR